MQQPDVPAAGEDDHGLEADWVASVIRWGFFLIEVVIFSVVLLGVGYAFYSEAASREAQGVTHGAHTVLLYVLINLTLLRALCAA